MAAVCEIGLTITEIHEPTEQLHNYKKNKWVFKNFELMVTKANDPKE